jgi:hypothetical protein
MDHPRGLKHKDRISYKKPPYLDHRDDDAKMIQLKGFKSKVTSVTSQPKA